MRSLCAWKYCYPFNFNICLIKNNHSISNRKFCCFSCIITMVHKNSPTAELWWGRLRKKLRRGNTEPSMGFRKANTEPSAHFRRVNTEPSVHFRRANMEPSVHFRRANTEPSVHFRRANIREVVKLKIHVFAYKCIFSLTTSRNWKLIFKADLKWECPYFYSKFFFWSVSVSI